MHLKPSRPCRLDDELYLKLKYIAKEENRSYNNYIETVLMQIVKQYEEQNGAIHVDTDKLYEQYSFIKSIKRGLQHGDYRKKAYTRRKRVF